MEIIDAQVHIVDGESVHSPGAGTRTTMSRHVSIEQMLAAMRGVGVDAALVTGQSSRGPDNSYLLRAAREYPDQFAAIGTIDFKRPDLEEQMRVWRGQDGMLGVRVVLITDEQVKEFRCGSLNRLFAAAQRHAVPVFVYPPKLLRELAQSIEAYPGTQFVIDHMGLPQPTPFADRDPQPFERLPQLLELARFDNVAVKITGAPTLSTRAYPYEDLWPHLRRILDAFGVDRTMWGSDWTRTTRYCTYAQAVGYMRDSFELSLSEKEKVFGATLRRLLRWDHSH